MAAYNDVVKSYKVEQDFYKKQLETTTDLAGVGLSVETASHDIMMMLNKGVEAIDSLIKDINGNVLSETKITEELLKIRGIFSFVDTQMKDIQLLFKSSKQRRRAIRVSDILEKVVTIYKRTFRFSHCVVCKRGTIGCYKSLLASLAIYVLPIPLSPINNIEKPVFKKVAIFRFINALYFDFVSGKILKLSPISEISFTGISLMKII